MARGCPCIVADTGGLREVVPAGERVGLRFNGGDAEHLGVMIERLLTDDELRDRLVPRRRARAALRLGGHRPPDERALRARARERRAGAPLTAARRQTDIRSRARDAEPSPRCSPALARPKRGMLP